MYELSQHANELKEEIQEAIKRLQLDSLKSRLEALRVDTEKPDFWADNQHAGAIMKQINKLESRIQPWEEVMRSVEEVVELSELGDKDLAEDLNGQLTKASETYEQLKRELKLAGPYDDFDAILSIHAGAGGTDAQDWAGMLLRMYVRWAETHNMTVSTIEESSGEEAGIKSVTLEVSGPFAYGKLKGEHGVHRLVRLSPFNADNLRQTSFAKVEVLPKIDKPEDVEVDDKDLKIDVYRAGGHGGQSVNTTDSAVRVTHVPTGIVVAIQNERSQLQNKETALTILRSRLAQLQTEQHLENMRGLKGPNQSAEWGNQIRSYVLHPYKQVKDLRTRHESSDPDSVLDGKLDEFIDAYLEYNIGGQ